MKKIIIWLIIGTLAITMAFMGVACKAATATTTAAAKTTTAETAGKKFTVGYDIYWLGNAWSLQFAEEFKYAVQQPEYADLVEKVYYTSSEADVAKNVSNFEDLVAKGCDIIFITPMTPDNLVDSIKKAMDKGIKVVIMGSAITGDNYTAYVNTDDKEWGVNAAKYIATATGGKGKIAMINGISGSQTCVDTLAGAMSVFKDYPDIKPLQEAYGSWDFSKTKIVMQDLLQANPDIAGIWTYSEPRACLEVYIDNNIPFVPITIHGENGELKLWKQYKDKGMVAEGITKPTYISKIALGVGMAALTGKAFEKVTIVPPTKITVNDIDSLIKPDLSDKLRFPTDLPDSKLQELFAQ